MNKTVWFWEYGEMSGGKAVVGEKGGADCMHANTKLGRKKAVNVLEANKCSMVVICF